MASAVLRQRRVKLKISKATTHHSTNQNKGWVMACKSLENENSIEICERLEESFKSLLQ
jgi:hypothetical protein